MSRRKIVIVRTAEDSAELEQAVRASGFEPLVEPILSIEYLDELLPEMDGGTPLIFTSANGVRALAERTAFRSNPVYTVGRNTSDEALRVGYENIETAAGTAEDLIEMLQNSLKTPLKGAIYVRAEDVSRDLAVILEEKGIILREFIAYRANPAENLSINLLQALDGREVEAFMFFSVRGGQVFAELIEQYGRIGRLRPTKALCISEAVLKSVSV